ncbi:MAG: TRAP transporter small permease [Deltaproteobacteria bacterium]|nr:TRAP transporter small permease [Deltaproteobacteria bacterium]
MSDLMKTLSLIVNRVCELGLVLFLSAMAVAVILEVIFRYVLNLPLFWTEEFARYCLVWSSLLGAAVAFKRGEHLAVAFFMDHLPERPRRFFAGAALLFIALILAVMTWGGAQLVAITRAQISPALRIPMAVPYLALPFGSGVMLLHVISSFTKQGDRRPRETR